MTKCIQLGHCWQKPHSSSADTYHFFCWQPSFRNGWFERSHLTLLLVLSKQKVLAMVGSHHTQKRLCIQTLMKSWTASLGFHHAVKFASPNSLNKKSHLKSLLQQKQRLQNHVKIQKINCSSTSLHVISITAKNFFKEAQTTTKASSSVTIYCWVGWCRITS